MSDWGSMHSSTAVNLTAPQQDIGLESRGPSGKLMATFGEISSQP